MDPVPKNYAGPTATIRDSMEYEGEDFYGTPMYYVRKFDGKPIENAESATQEKSRGMGFGMFPVGASRKVPIRKMKLTLVARNVQATALEELNYSLTGKAFKAEGDVEFEPRPDRVYIVRGKVGPKLTSVWIEDFVTHEILTEKIEASQKK